MDETEKGLQDILVIHRKNVADYERQQAIERRPSTSRRLEDERKQIAEIKQRLRKLGVKVDDDALDTDLKSDQGAVTHGDHSQPARKPTISEIRQFLSEAFSDEEITALCTDHFPQVANSFAVSMTKGQKIQLLIEYCQRREIMADLINTIAQLRPGQFKQRFGNVQPADTIHPPPTAPKEFVSSSDSKARRIDIKWLTGIIVAVLACIAAWLVVPEFRQLLTGILPSSAAAPTIAPTRFLPRSLTPTQIPPTATSIATPEPSPTVAPMSTVISVPTDLPASAASVQTPMFFFVDDFNGSAIDLDRWNDKAPGLTVRDGYLVADFEHDGKDFGMQSIEAKLDNRRFQIVELSAVVLDASGDGKLGFNTSCSGKKDSTLVFEIRPGNIIDGHYDSSAGQIYLDWKPLSTPAVTFTVRLIQDGDVVRVYVNDVEMQEPYPCAAMGEWFVIGSGASPKNYIKGYYDFVRLGSYSQ